MSEAKEIVDILLEEIDPEELVHAARRPVIKTAYYVITPESAEQGDYAENGWEDEEGEEMVLDDFDREEGLDVADLAIQWLRKKGIWEASSSAFHPGIWYSGRDAHDFRTGAETYHTYHLKNFTPEQERKIYDAIKQRGY